MDIYTAILAVLVVILILLNIYQYLVQRAALRIAEILFVMSRNVREKANEVRLDGKDVEIIEAHLFDVAPSARSLLKALGRSEKSIDPDPMLSISSTNGHRIDSESLTRLADNIFFAVMEEQPEASWDDTTKVVLERFMQKVPSLEREAARRIVNVVAHQNRNRQDDPAAAGQAMALAGKQN
ncbi:hypothetical protein MK163_03085 [bacterium]|nr:hypothetical protein [bacterium]